MCGGSSSLMGRSCGTRHLGRARLHLLQKWCGDRMGSGRRRVCAGDDDAAEGAKAKSGYPLVVTSQHGGCVGSAPAITAVAPFCGCPRQESPRAPSAQVPPRPDREENLNSRKHHHELRLSLSRRANPDDPVHAVSGLEPRPLQTLRFLISKNVGFLGCACRGSPDSWHIGRSDQAASPIINAASARCRQPFHTNKLRRGKLMRSLRLSVRLDRYGVRVNRRVPHGMKR